MECEGETHEGCTMWKHGDMLENYSRCLEVLHEEFIPNGADPVNISDSTLPLYFLIFSFYFGIT